MPDTSGEVTIPALNTKDEENEDETSGAFKFVIASQSNKIADDSINFNK